MKRARHRTHDRLKRRGGMLATGIAAALVLSACGGAADGVEEPAEASGEDTQVEPAGEPVHVVATTSILGDVVSNLVGDDGRVDVIMPPGADPHGFEPSAADGALLRDADLVVANGLDLEENLMSVLEAVEEEGIRVLTLADKLDPIDYDFDGPHDHGDGHAHGDEEEAHAHGDEEDGHAHGEEEEAHDDHAHGPEDPHVWFDPVRMADGVRLLAAELAEVDSSLDSAEWEARGEAYAQQLLEVHAELEEIFAGIDDHRRVLVTNHDALGYLADRYGFEVLGTVIPGASTEADTDPRSFAELIATVERAEVPAIFAENVDSTRLAEQLASEVIGRSDLEIEVVRIYTDALGEPGSGAEDYLGMLRTTATLIADALR